MKTVYLAGPIFGCDKSEANDWRDYVSRAIAPHGIKGISPLRCEELVGERYNVTGVDPLFGSDEAIATKNLYDVMACDMTLGYMPKTLMDRRPSWGTMCEIAWAKMARKPAVLVSDCPILLTHPVVKSCVGWRVKTLEEGIATVVGMLRDYAHDLEWSV